MSKTKDCILYIDDEKANLNAFRMAMGVYFKVFITENSDEAIELIKTEDIKVVISDQRMPKVSGIDFLAKVKNNFPDKVCIMLTAFSDSDVMLKAINEGNIFRFMMKPWDKDDMYHALKSAIEVYNLNKQNKELIAHLKDKNQELVAYNEELLATTDSLRLTEEKLLKQNKELDKAKRKAEENDKLKTSFLNNLSHEIRTPLNGILGFSSLLTKDTLPQEKRTEFGNIINDSGAQLLDIVNDILDISKIETNQIVISCTDVDVNLELINLKKFFKPQFEEKGLSLFLEIPNNSNSPVVVTDKTRLIQVLTNLIKNASKFTPEGYVKFGYRFIDNYIRFFVEDSGIGIAGENHKSVFERFRRISDENIVNFRGTGLGLSISKAFIEKLGGEIGLESELGKGSTFYFTLPFESKVNEHSDKNANPELEPEAQFSGSKVLIVDDEPINQYYLREVLTEMAIHPVMANNGVEAVNIIKSDGKIDLVLMDLKMPVMDGYTATRQIKQYNSNIPIVAQTAHAMVDDKEKALSAGCDDYISKPINRKALGVILNRFLK